MATTYVVLEKNRGGNSQREYVAPRQSRVSKGSKQDIWLTIAGAFIWVDLCQFGKTIRDNITSNPGTAEESIDYY